MEVVELLLKQEGIELYAQAKKDHGLIKRGDTPFQAACKGCTARHMGVADALTAVGGDKAPPRRKSSFELAAEAAGSLYSSFVGS